MQSFSPPRTDSIETIVRMIVISHRAIGERYGVPAKLPLSAVVA